MRGRWFDDTFSRNRTKYKISSERPYLAPRLAMPTLFYSKLRRTTPTAGENLHMHESNNILTAGPREPDE